MFSPTIFSPSRLFFAWLLALLPLYPPAAQRALAAENTAVTLIVDYGDGVQKHITGIAWKEGMTVLDAMQHAAKHPRGVKFSYRGSAATAFLYKIDDLENEGRGRNWIYRVNGKLADRGFAVCRLMPTDVVLWKFEKLKSFPPRE